MREKILSKLWCYSFSLSSMANVQVYIVDETLLRTEHSMQILQVALVDETSHHACHYGELCLVLQEESSNGARLHDGGVTALPKQADREHTHRASFVCQQRLPISHAIRVSNCPGCMLLPMQTNHYS